MSVWCSVVLCLIQKGGTLKNNDPNTINILNVPIIKPLKSVQNNENWMYAQCFKIKFPKTK